MSIGQIKLYDLFRKELRLPDDKAAAFVLAVGEVGSMEASVNQHLNATKGDVHLLKEDIHSLDLNIEQSKSEVFKAIVWIGIAQYLAILGGVLAIVKFMR
jgi:hypothetical protein